MSSIGLLFAIAPLLAPTTVPLEAPRPAAREQIGTVLGEPIYRDQIRKDFPLSAELHRLVGPATQRYREQHREQIEPTDAELKFAADYFRRKDPEKWQQRAADRKEQFAKVEETLDDPDLTVQEKNQKEARLRFLSQPPGRFFARFIVGGRKFNRHLYEAFGGGRLLWQQAGVEAFDAHRRWLETLEERGDFSFADPALRATFYEYWASQEDRRSGLWTLEEDPQMFDEFLNPPWFPAEPAAATGDTRP